MGATEGAFFAAKVHEEERFAWEKGPMLHTVSRVASCCGWMDAEGGKRSYVHYFLWVIWEPEFWGWFACWLLSCCRIRPCGPSIVREWADGEALGNIQSVYGGAGATDN